MPAGVGVAMGMGQGWPIVLIMGVATGTFGGLMRDVVCNEVPLVLKKGEIYATAAFSGALGALALAQFTQSILVILLGCGITVFALRAGSMLFGWCLPVYKSRPPKN